MVQQADHCVWVFIAEYFHRGRVRFQWPIIPLTCVRQAQMHRQRHVFRNTYVCVDKTEDNAEQ